MFFNLNSFWQPTIFYFFSWYGFCAILTYFVITLMAHDNAIARVSSSSSFKRYPRNSIPSAFNITVFTKYIYFLFAPRTPRGRTSTRALSIKGIKFNSNIKPHDLSPRFTWRKGRIEDYFYDADGKWTGMHVVKVQHLFVSQRKAISLKHPSFRINFIPNLNFSQGLTLTEAPTLAKAQRIAESYYKEWLEINK